MMNIEWSSILFVIIILFVALLIIKYIEKKTNVNGELKRKMFHVSMGLVMLTFPFIFKSIYSVGLLGIIAFIIMFALKNSKLKNTLGTVLYSVQRESMGEIFFVISVFLIFYLSKGDKILFSIPILILTFADSTAAIIGKNYGKKNLAEINEDAKSLEGSFMFFMVAFMATLVPLLLYTQVGREETLIISTIVGINVALVEMISHNGNDNLLIPLTTYAFLFIHLGQNLQILRKYLVAFGIIFILVTITNRVKSLSKLAIVEAIVVGYLTAILYGGYAIIPPLMLILTVMRFPSKKENEKNNLYDARIIETNIIIPVAICGIVAITGWKKELFMIYATAYSMHLIVNTFVRFKYYIGYSDLDSIVLAIIKGIGFIFIPSLLIQTCIIKCSVSIIMWISMVIAMSLSAIMIYVKKKNVSEEKISVNNGLMHMQIVLVLTIFLSVMQILTI